MNTPPMSHPCCVWDIRAQLGEGPVWSVREQALYFVDIVGQAIHRLDPASGAQASWQAPARPGFVVPASDGTLVCGLKDGLYRLDPRTGAFDRMLAVEPEHPGNRINDGCVDSRGRLWFGTMDDGEGTPSGALYSVTRQAHGLDLLRHDEGYVVTNGPGISPDGTRLYHNHSPAGLIYVFDLAADGSLSNRRVFARVEDGYPDGVVVDSAGTLWVGVWNGGRIERFRPDGTRLAPIAMPARNVTKVAFGGADLRTLYVTTARKNTPDDMLARYPQAGSLFSLRVDVPGQEPHAFPAA
ncbi:SMP-30/gluconolactonase/LRE family protein [Komagataeibacter sp. AV436]|uniref:SMP-30/gluconolactonase/LRE family protein n=1 Tax=Komagataeibacter melomenusus TaxID=2766578 RepID=A0ABX2AIG8_9PROT|nr:SMP-30/gluconolactonase/LRE family protein [Komagataeibacter melomenusus]MBV1832036.1 SMP-30/gluconolactonase/LRE family protein [Komagataeibacter melomenusus]NPC67973.1 SMP-30/gluconolactonase/LRE family protein [Komagataeibacter melomenusus]